MTKALARLDDDLSTHQANPVAAWTLDCEGHFAGAVILLPSFGSGKLDSKSYREVDARPNCCLSGSVDVVADCRLHSRVFNLADCATPLVSHC